MERVAGIEPAFTAWKAVILPLNYTRMPSQSYHRHRLDDAAQNGKSCCQVTIGDILCFLLRNVTLLGQR